MAEGEETKNKEITILIKDSVTITNRRVVFNGKTYTVSNIASVGKERISPSIGCWPIVIAGWGIIIFISSFFTDSFSIGGPVACIGGAAAFMSIAYMTSQKTEFSVVLTTSAGEIKAYTSEDENSINEIVKALNNAIIEAE